MAAPGVKLIQAEVDALDEASDRVTISGGGLVAHAHRRADRDVGKRRRGGTL